MPNKHLVGVRFDDATYKELEECARLDDRKIPAVIRRIVTEFLPAFKAKLEAAKALVMDETKGKYEVRARPACPKPAKRNDRN